MDVRQALFPYGMEMAEDGAWVFFNREYKPVGMNTRERIKYDEHPVRFWIKGLGPSTREKLCIDGSGTQDRIYLYNDATQPTRSAANMSAYLKRLEILMRLTSPPD